MVNKPCIPRLIVSALLFVFLAGVLLIPLSAQALETNYKVSRTMAVLPYTVAPYKTASYEQTGYSQTFIRDALQQGRLVPVNYKKHVVVPLMPDNDESAGEPVETDNSYGKKLEDN